MWLSGAAATLRQVSHEGDQLAPRHPSLDRRSFVLWTGYRGGIDLGGLSRSVTNAVAVPLRHVAGEQAVIEQARALGMGVVLPGQAWLNQLEPAERGAGFSALPYAQPGPVSPEWLSSSAQRDYAEAFIEAQLLGCASLVTTPAHVLDEELGHARGQELSLAYAAVEAWEARQGWHAPPDRPQDPWRELHATIAVRGAHVGEAATGLVERYSELPVEGYWIVVVNGGSSARQLGGLARLALGLQRETGRPVTVSGVAGLHVALLASGVAATCAGLHGMRPTFPPVRLEEHDDAGGADIHVYHPAILGPIPLGAGYDGVRNRLFALQPCTCGHHVPHRPPAGRRDVIAHNTSCLESEALDATFMTPAIDEQRLLSRVARADRLRRSLGMSDLPHGWHAVAPAARALRAGEDLAEDA